MKAGNEELLQQKARAEREHMLKEARDIRDKESGRGQGPRQNRSRCPAGPCP
jgi:hypothetical protein